MKKAITFLLKVERQPAQYLLEQIICLLDQNHPHWLCYFETSARTGRRHRQICRQYCFLDKRFRISDQQGSFVPATEFSARLHPMHLLQSCAVLDILNFMNARHLAKLWVNTREMFPANPLNPIICYHKNIDSLIQRGASDVVANALVVERHLEATQKKHRKSDVLESPLYIIRNPFVF